MTFRLTYATMYNPPEAMHEGFEAALARVEALLGARHPMFIDGSDREAAHHADHRSPIDLDLRLGTFALAGEADVDAAMQAAHRAFPAWRATTAAERVRLLRRVADIMEERVYDIAAALVLEVGKNRVEALAEAQETVDFFRLYADDFENHDGYACALPNDPVEGFVSRNASVMRPYGAWVVIAPFNFPLALAGGPVAAALVTGNTVVVKCAGDTPWAGRLLADCARDARLPAGVFNYLSGSSREIGDALVRHPLTGGTTFTGSVPVGHRIMRHMADGSFPRPCIAEMGGKNPCIVTANADLDRAAAGIVRSAYGMGGQKCSALSRLYVHESVADALIERLARQIGALAIGDPRQRKHWLGPVVNETAYRNFARHVEALREGGARLIAGGAAIADGDRARGWYVEPTLAEAPLHHPLWQHEMFLPILMLHRYRDNAEAMRLANDTTMGLTAGFYGSDEELAWFHEHIEAGVTYANRPQGATTGAWPGYQPFGGWKGSGSTGKAIASFYYLAQYLREQSRTVVEGMITTLADAIARFVPDGASVALEGFTHLIPFAAGHEVVRQRRRDLHLIRMTPDLVYDQLIGMGCARRLTFSWGGNPGVGSLHRLRDAVENGWPRPLEIDEHSHAGMAAAFTAGAARLPFGVLRGYIGTDLPAHNPRIRSVQCPFTGETLAAVPAINPDVTILHAQRADRAGNVAIHGILGAAREAAFAAAKLIVTVEEIVDALPPAMNGIVLPHWVVSAVAHVPGGAYPSYAHGHYARDNAFYQRWDAIARERDTFTAWMQHHVLDTSDHAGFLRTLRRGGRVITMLFLAGFLRSLRAEAA